MRWPFEVAEETGYNYSMALIFTAQHTGSVRKTGLALGGGANKTQEYTSLSLFVCVLCVCDDLSMAMAMNVKTLAEMVHGAMN